LPGKGTNRRKVSKPPRSKLLQFLRDRRDIIAESWYQAVRGTGFVPLAAAEVRQRLGELTDEVIACLVAEPFESARAKAVGAALARLHFLHPEGSGATQEVLTLQLVEGLSSDQCAALRPRLALVLGGLVEGYFRQACETLLAEQEQIRDAFLTELRRTADALRKREETARAFLNAPSDLMLLIDLDGTLVDFNSAVAEALGIEASERADICVFDLFPPEVAELRKTKVEKVVRSGEAVHFEDQRDGRWFDNSIYPVFNARGEVRQVVVFCLDVTERKLAEKALRGHAERLEILRKIDNAILAAQSLEEIAQAVLRYVWHLVPCQRASVALFDWEANESKVLAVQTSAETAVGTGTCFPLAGEEEGLKILRRGEVFITGDIPSFSASSLVAQMIGDEGMCACIAVPLVSRGELFGSFNLWSDRPSVFASEHVQVARELAGLLAIAIQQARLFQSLEQKGDRLRALGARLAEAREDEQRRLARDLHDRVGENLTALSINLEMARSGVPEDASSSTRSYLDEALVLVDKTADCVRDVMADLRPPILDDYGLVATLHWYGSRFESWTGITVTVEGEEPDPRLAEQAEINLFRIAQEVLTNVAKHSHAAHVLVTVKEQSETVRVVIADDGVGFDPARVDRPHNGQGWGLINMAERTEAMGGRFRVESRPQYGTRVIVEVSR
jgi:PAS domain S-box-containing protein